jgi:hypothetical protein
MAMSSERSIPLYPSFAEWQWRYNVPASECDPEKAHNTVPDPPPLFRLDEPTSAEHWEVYEALLPVIARHGPTEPVDDRETCLWLIDDHWCGDRTQYICAYGDCYFTEPLVRDLQAFLRDRYPLWRVMLTADIEDDVIFVYPEAVRNNEAGPDELVAETCRRVAEHLRLHKERRLRYLPQPKTEELKIPPFPSLSEAKIHYNNAEAYEGSASWNSVPSPPKLTDEEVERFHNALSDVIRRYGPRSVSNKESETAKRRQDLFWLITTTADYFWRTRIVRNYGELTFTEPMVRDIQQLLQKYRLWRVMLDADEQRDVLVVYPDVVRNDDAPPDEPLATTIARVADHYWRRRAEWLRTHPIR